MKTALEHIAGYLMDFIGFLVVSYLDMFKPRRAR